MVDHICPKNHVNVTVKATTAHESELGLFPGDVKATGKVSWAAFYEETFSFFRSLASSGQVEYRAEITGIGLSQAFGNSPASLSVEIELTYPVPTAGADPGPAIVQSVRQDISYSTYVRAPAE